MCNCDAKSRVRSGCRNFAGGFVMVLSGKTNFSRESCNGSFETCCNMSNSNFVRDALEGNFCDLVFEEVPVNGKLGKYVKGMGRL